MKSLVLVPYVESIAKVRALDAIAGQWPDAVFVPLPEEDDGAQARCLFEAFRSGRDFCIVAHDVIPPDGSFDELFGCEHPWCGYRVRLGAQPVPMTLSLDRFRAAVGIEHPAMVEQVLRDPRGTGGWRAWWALDTLLANRMQVVGYEWHEHAGTVEHLHDYDRLEEA